MEEKTEQLRDIFMEVADEETVTETQSDTRGSLVRTGSVDDRLRDVVSRARERFDFETALDDESLCEIVKRFHDGDSDGEIAAALSVPEEAVFTARMDLHLVREDDTGIDGSTLRDHVDGDVADPAVDDTALAARLDVDPGTVARARRVHEARREAQLVSHRFRTEFEEVLTDADIAVQFTPDAREDGLAEAAEDIETEVEF